MRIRLRCALEELLGRTLKAQPLIAFQQGWKPQPPIQTAPHEAGRVLKAEYSDRVKLSVVKVVVGG